MEKVISRTLETKLLNTNRLLRLMIRNKQVDIINY